MPDPTIREVGRFQFAKVRISGKDDQLGVREGPHLPWMMLGDLFSVGTGLYYASALFTATPWSMASVSPGTVSGQSVYRDGFVVSSRSKGAAFRSTAATDAGKARDILVGLTQSHDLNLGLPDAQALNTFLQELLTTPSIFEGWIPVDADSSELSKRVDYGRA